MNVDINLLYGGAVLAGAASALLYLRKKRWTDAALALAAGASMAALLAAPAAPAGGAQAIVLATGDLHPVTPAPTQPAKSPSTPPAAAGTAAAANRTAAAPGAATLSAFSAAAGATPAGAPAAAPASPTAASFGAASASLVPDDRLAAGLAAFSQASRVEVQGHGLHEAQWRDMPVRPIEWTQAKDDLLWLDFPRALPLGRNFALTARRGVSQPGWRLQLLAENGQVLAEARAVSAADALTVQWQPPMAEAMVLHARLLDKDSKPIAQGPIPLRVMEAVPLQVQGRFGAPSFDARVLNQLLTDSNAIVDWQTTLGKSLTRSEEARAPLTHPNALVADAAWLERGNLRAALAQVAQGMPLLVLGGDAGDAALWQRELGLRLAPQSATTEQEDTRHMTLAGATLAFAPGAQTPAANAGAGWQAAARDRDAKPWLWQRDWQKGRILWLGVRDWHRHAISEPAALGQWWQQVLDLAALGSEQKVRWVDADPMPLTGLRAEVCAQGVATGGAVNVGQEVLRWQARSDRADAACVALWPRASGWLPVRSGDAESALYVYAAQDWPAWQAALRHDATARYASRSRQPVAGRDAAQDAVPGAARNAARNAAAAAAQRSAGAMPLSATGNASASAGESWAQAWAGSVPRWLLGMVFAASMLLLWWRERR